ncbi:MAG TPA: PKD domain-containing protein [Candidatus Paceibacterota bacterium]|nr:PKD domain-containing protein [Candidatus Paceibacterota bacterium]
MRTQNFWKAATLAVLLFPFAASAQVAQFAFTTSPQNVAPNTVSEIVTIQAQDSTGSSVSLTQTACLHFSSTSSNGQFSSSATNWTPVSALTMNKSTANKNFYHKDSIEGTHKLSVQIALRPESETSPCASWPTAEWNIQWTITQDIVIASAQSGSGGTGSETQNQATTTTTTTTSTNTPAPTSSYVAPPEPQIFADAGDNRTVIVAADTEFLGRAYNRKKETISSRIRFLWNFGDGRTAEGESVLHHFEYPGRYAVVLNIAENRDAASDRIIVTAEPAKLALTAFSDGSIMIGNSAGHDLDLSRWIVRSFGRSFVLPQGSIILAGESLRMGEKILGFRSSPETELDYPNGALALRAGTASADADSGKSDMSAAAPLPANSPATPDTPAAPPPVPSDAEEEQGGVYSTETVGAADSIEDTPASSSQAAAGAAVSDSGGAYLWWLGAIGLAVVGGGAMVAARHVRRREWDIVEEKEG